MIRWEAVATRAAGLSSHRLDRRTLDELAAAPDLSAVAATLARTGVTASEHAAADPTAVTQIRGSATHPTAAGLELAIRRHAARAVATLARWLEVASARDAVAVFLAAEDLASLRALVRGAVAGAPAEVRLAGLVPTPWLPLRALELLAHEAKPARIAALVVAWRHPFGAALADAVGESAEPDLFRVEAALLDAYARFASRGAKQAGDALVTWVAETIDAANLVAALRLAEQGHDVDAARVFVAGGALVDRDTFVAAAGASDASEATVILAASCERRDRGLGTAIRAAGGDPVALEVALATRRSRALRQQSAGSPIGPARVALFFVALANEVRNLRALVWGVALGVPPETRRAAIREV